MAEKIFLDGEETLKEIRESLEHYYGLPWWLR